MTDTDTTRAAIMTAIVIAAAQLKAASDAEREGQFLEDLADKRAAQKYAEVPVAPTGFGGLPV